MNGLQYRKAVRDAVKAALAASFNTTHLALANDYGVTPISLDFTNASKNVVQAKFNPDEIELSPILDMTPAGLAIYTDSTTDTGRARGYRFVGPVVFGIDGIYTAGDGAETSDTESILDAFEDAVLISLNSYQWPLTNDVSLIFARETKIERSNMKPLAEGYRQWFTLAGRFNVTVP